jgi:hypothetical protein
LAQCVGDFCITTQKKHSTAPRPRPGVRTGPPDGRLTSLDELRDAILAGAVTRIRPKVMTVTAITVGLLPVMWSNGINADTMKRIAAPMVGGVFSSFLMELLVYPAIYEIWNVIMGLLSAYP